MRWLVPIALAGCGSVTPTGRVYSRPGACPASYAAAQAWGNVMTTDYRPTTERCSYPQGECVLDGGEGHPHESYQCRDAVGAYFQDKRCPDVPYTFGADLACTPDEVCRYFDGHVITWECRAGTLSQDDLREDGCPVFAPDAGAACPTAVPGGCRWPGKQGACVDGHWRITPYLPL